MPCRARGAVRDPFPAVIEPRREVLCGWGGANRAVSWVYRPRSAEEVAEAATDARRRGLTIAHRGAGQSYGDAALNEGGAVLVLQGLDRVLEFDPEAGVVRAQAGVTIDRLWRTGIEAGWWPAVVPGTSRPTLGGCVGMNVHGKNHFRTGSFGEHLRSLTVLSPEGEVRRLTPEDPAFARQVGGQGLQGTILEVEVRLGRVGSGYLAVEARSAGGLEEAMDVLDRLAAEHEYAVAWIDCFARGGSLGRGELHGASNLPPGHPRAAEAMSVQAQVPGPRAAGVLPRRWMSAVLRLLANDPGMRALDLAKSVHARVRHPSTYLEPHARFHFLLDYVPDWKRAYGAGGLLQYQLFVPETDARAAFREALELQQRTGIVSWLGVLKRHRRDPFASNYSVDGYSLALDFPVREARLGALTDLLAAFDDLLEAAGGHVYAAKDAVSRLGRPPAASDAYQTNLSRRWGRNRPGLRHPGAGS